MPDDIPDAPNLPGSVRVAERDALFDDLGNQLATAAIEAVRERGAFHLALSGGSTPEPFYMRLVTDPRLRLIPWRQTHIWIVDERRVPEDDERSNIRMIREALTDQADVPDDHVHPMPVLADDPAGGYEATLRDTLGGGVGTGGVPRLDLVLLGMGDDCHTASLFPRSDAIGVDDRLIVVNAGEHVTPPDRVTMTYPLLNAARRLDALVTGAKKTDALRRVAGLDAPDPVHVPISGIRPTNGVLTWWLDPAAAGQSA